VHLSQEALVVYLYLVCSNHLFFGWGLNGFNKSPVPFSRIPSIVFYSKIQLEQRIKGPFQIAAVWSWTWRVTRLETVNCLCVQDKTWKNRYCFLRFCQQEHMTGRTVRTKWSTIHAKKRYLPIWQEFFAGIIIKNQPIPPASVGCDWQHIHTLQEPNHHRWIPVSLSQPFLCRKSSLHYHGEMKPTNFAA